MLVEIIVEGSVQGQEGKRCRVWVFRRGGIRSSMARWSSAARVFGRDLEIVLRERRRDRRRKADRDQGSERRVPVILSFTTAEGHRYVNLSIRRRARDDGAGAPGAGILRKPVNPLQDKNGRFLNSMLAASAKVGAVLSDARVPR
jgi:hypothetical protein